MAEKYYSTSRVLRTGTTSTLALQVWKALSDALVLRESPMTGTELAAAVGQTPEAIDALFDSVYYQKHYGFARFDSYEAWRSHFMETGVLYNPALHDPKPAQEAAAAPAESQA
jgi:hypothetical protein